MTSGRVRQGLAWAALCLIIQSTPSCASFGGWIETCAWLEVAAEGVELGETRKLQGYGTDACGVTGTYTLRRESYRLEFWNGSGLGAVLTVRAIDHKGERLAIRSDQLSEMDPYSNRFDDPRYNRYTHRMVVPARTVSDAPSPLAMELVLGILSLDGQLLATETVPLLLRSGRFRARDW
ncbi:MAG: hypothetical protein JNL48_21275 [Acidobacteria bacterium]|nr:hypothetical protein [Acidobacteriota bacterium]